MSKFVVDVEATGPCPGLYSMISFGAVSYSNPKNTFYSGILKPLPASRFDPGAMKVTGTSIDDMKSGRDIYSAMQEFDYWLSLSNTDSRPMFFSDNNGFDWQFINYYFHLSLGRNPFGFSSTNIGSLYKGMVKDMRKNFKHLRKTKHTHHPVDDAMGNVEALKAIAEMGIKL